MHIVPPPPEDSYSLEVKYWVIQAALCHDEHRVRHSSFYTKACWLSREDVVAHEFGLKKKMQLFIKKGKKMKML